MVRNADESQKLGGCRSCQVVRVATCGGVSVYCYLNGMGLLEIMPSRTGRVLWLTAAGCAGAVAVYNTFM
jgi:hypothetical protein